MPIRRDAVNKFNRGEVSSQAEYREDVEKVNNSAGFMENFMPVRLGSMIYRPGTLYKASSIGDYMVEFVRSTTETAILGFTGTTLKIWDNIGGALVDQPQGQLTLTNEEFTSNISGWTDSSGSGSSTAWETGGYANLLGTGATAAKLYQQFGGSGFDGNEHCIQITILRAPVEVKIGESGVDSTEIFQGVLEPGTHSLVFTPSSTAPTITLVNGSDIEAWVDEVSLGDDGTLEFTLPTTITDPATLRYAQSADVVFFASGNTPQFKVERRGQKSWSLVDYRVDDGPFGLVNNTEITLTPGALEGDTTLTASSDLFTSSDVGNLYKLTSAGQQASANVTAQDSGTGSIRVTGVDAVRKFTYSRSGTWSATVTLQRSTDDVSWSDVQDHTGNGTVNYDDGLDNSILYYRLWVKTGDYTSGTVELNISYDAGSKDGIARVTEYNSATSVDVQVLQDFGATDATRDWYVGEWNTSDGHPTAVELYEGRLFWAGRTKLWGSVSDAFASFDDTLEGNDRPISGTIGFGPVDNVDWLAASSRLLMGVPSDVISVRSSSFGEALTQDNRNLKSGSRQGTFAMMPIRFNDDVLYIHRSGVRLMSAAYGIDKDTHLSNDLTIMNPDMFTAGITRIALSSQPEPRIYAVMDDGTMRVMLYDPTEDVLAWSRITLAEGTFEDIVTLPGLVEDEVWVRVTRNGADYLEKFSMMSDVVDQHYDGAVLYTSPGSTTLTGLAHLEGDTVSVWADDQYRETAVVSSGQITVSSDAWTDVTVGLAYDAYYQSNRVGAVTGAPSVIGIRKRVTDVSLAMSNYWPDAITYGYSQSDLDNMPDLEDGTAVTTTALIASYDEYPFEFNGETEIDPRIWIKATGPCTIHAISYAVWIDDDTFGQQ